MVYVVSNVSYPSDKSKEVAAKWMENLKKFPPDPSVGKTILVLVRPSNKGVHVISVGKPEKGKLEEYILRATQSGEDMTSVIGFTYELKVYLDYTEAYKALDMSPPKEI